MSVPVRADVRRASRVRGFPRDPGPAPGCYSRHRVEGTTSSPARPFSRARFCAAAVPALWAALAALAASTGAQAPPHDPLAFFEPTVTFSAQDRARLARGQTLVKSVAPAEGQVAIVSAVRGGFDGDRLVQWVRRIDAMKRGRYAPAVVRFSDPPRLEDLALLELDADDLEDLRHCRPGSCAIRLSEPEIAAIAPLARSRAPGWQASVQRAFRAAMLERTGRYLGAGLAGVPPYRDQAKPAVLEAEFRALLAESPFLPARLPRLADYLARFPQAPGADVESFVYWSKEILGRRPVISITHVTITRPANTGDAYVVSRQVYASHYLTGSIAVTASVGGVGDAPRYLLYLNRSRVDVLDGLLGGLVRRIVERRLRDEAGTLVEGLRRRLEAGEPPSD